jgi:hypothetical protein
MKKQYKIGHLFVLCMITLSLNAMASKSNFVLLTKCTDIQDNFKHNFNKLNSEYEFDWAESKDPTPDVEMIKSFTSMSVSASPNPVCAGSSVNVTWTFNRGNLLPGVAEYSTNNISWSALGTTSPKVISFTPASTTTYYGRVRSLNGGPTYSGQVTVTVNAVPGTTTVSGGGNYCGSASLTATGGADGTIYWQNTTSTGTSTGTSSSSQTVTSTGTYYFRARSGAGCWGVQGSAAVVIITPPTAPTSITGTASVCSGNSTSLTAFGGISGSGCTYQWYAGGCGSGTLLGTGVSLSVSPTVPTTYYVRRVGTSVCNGTVTGCASVTVTINSVSTPPTSVGIVIIP